MGNSSQATDLPSMSQKRVLLVSYSEDLHARSVAWAIRQKGHICVEWFCADFPTRTTVTVAAACDSDSERGPVVRHAANGFDSGLAPFHTIWLRRRNSPWLPPAMHQGDREVAKRQCECALSGLLAALDGPEVFWANHFGKEETWQLKVYQLREAKRAGLAIPETLVSNDPDEIRGFIKKCGGVAAHKLLEHAAWRTGDGKQVFSCYTSPVTLEDLPRDHTLRLCPAIFQPLLEKEFEVRVACFGDHLASLQIDSQSDQRARLDWRAGQWYVDMKPYTLPHGIQEGIRSFLRSTGMVCASFDFIVTPEGEHVFLECNPQGQFLWMEDRAGLPLLDVCAEFLIAGRRDFRPQPSPNPATWAAFLEAWRSGLKDQVYKGLPDRDTVAVPE